MAGTIIAERTTAEVDGDCVVFLMGWEKLAGWCPPADRARRRDRE